MSTAIGLPPSVVLSPAKGGMPALTISTPLCEAEIYLHGAHITHWKPTDSPPVIWMSEQALFQPDKAIRGGIPLCAPWFAGGPSGVRSPAHGWFRISEWTLADVADEGGVVTVRLTLDGPGASAVYEVRCADTLALSLTVQAVGGPLELEEAFHTYFAVSDVRDISIDGLSGCTYSDKTAGGRVSTQRGPVVLNAETDRVYAHEKAATIIDPGHDRRISVSKRGSLTSVVWNPWEAKARAMADFGDDAWVGMVCVETANAMGDAISLSEGASHTMTASITVTPGA